MKRMALIVGLALLVGACARTPEAGSGLTLVPRGDDVALQRDGVWRTVSETVSLSRGDRVKVSGLSRALVELPGGMLELRRGSLLRIGALPELESGSLLAQADSPLSVAVGPVQVRGESSVYRLDRSFSLRVGVYRGEVSLPGSGWDGTVRSLRQVGVVGGTVPRGPVALQVDPSDAWDDRLLGDAIGVGERLERLQQGVADQLPPRGGRDAVAEALRLDPRTVLRGIPERAPTTRLAEALVASIVASAAVPDGGDAAEKVFARVMALRGLGASWIVVAAEWQLAQSGLASLLEITGLLGGLTSPGATGPGSAGAGEGETGGSSAAGGSSGGGTDGGTGGGATDPSPPPPSACPDLVGCTVEEVLDLPPDLEDAPLP